MTEGGKDGQAILFRGCMEQTPSLVVNWASCATLQDQKKPLFPPQPESSPLSSAFAQVGNCRPFTFPIFDSAQLVQLTTN